MVLCPCNPCDPDLFQYAFLLTSSVLFAGGVINFFGLVSTPNEIGWY